MKLTVPLGRLQIDNKHPRKISIKNKFNVSLALKRHGYPKHLHARDDDEDAADDHACLSRESTVKGQALQHQPPHYQYVDVYDMLRYLSV